MTHAASFYSGHRWCDGRLGAVLAAWLMLCALPASALAADGTAREPDASTHAASVSAPHAGTRRHDELWLISTRKLPYDCRATTMTDLTPLRAYRTDGHARWAAAKLSDFALDSTLPTVFWVHGNRIDRTEAFYEGWEVYRALVRSADPEQPIRFIIWSWPTDQVKGVLYDVRLKARYSDPGAYYLARFLNRLDGQTPTSLVGFSYGARVITGALHLLSGGSLGPYTLGAPQNEARRPVRAVLWAAGLNDDWLAPGEYHGRALRTTEHLLLVNNSCDRVLRHYRLLDRCDRAAALGAVGLPSGLLPQRDRAKVEQVDACCEVGSDHTSWTYIHSRALMARCWSALVPDAPPAAAQAAMSRAVR